MLLVLKQTMRSTLCLTVLLAAASLSAQRPDRTDAPAGATPTIAARTASMTNMPGLLPLHWDVATGKLFLEIPVDARGKSADFIYTNSLPYGTGSNDLGLDRGQTAQALIVHFQRTGPKVLLIEPERALPHLVARRQPAARAQAVVPVFGAGRVYGRRPVGLSRHGRRH